MGRKGGGGRDVQEARWTAMRLMGWGPGKGDIQKETQGSVYSQGNGPYFTPEIMLLPPLTVTVLLST